LDAYYVITNINVKFMGYEIDYIAGGGGSRSGDAIAFRYGSLHGRREEQTVITIDGGTLESGEKLVEH